MKLKYLFSSLIAAAMMLVSCSDDNDPTYLDAIRVSSSYVALSVDGGQTSIDISAKGDWSIDEAGVPEWLTISPLSGSAGDSKITFSAASTIDGRTADVQVNCNGKTQNLKIIQGVAAVSPATCAEVIAGPDSKQYRVTGTVTRIANTTYGNFYLNDGTGEIYIYGTVNASGSYAWASFDIEVGDEVTVEGPKTTYNGTVELVDATFISVNKSLIKVDSLDIADNQLPLEGGDFTVSLTCKTSNGVSVEIPEDAQSWLSIVAINGGATPTVKFHAAANAGGDRETTIVFTTTDGKKIYSSETTISQKGAILEVSIADFLAAEPGNTLYRITGIITEVANASYGNVYVKDFSGTAYVYGIGSKGDFEAMGLKEGDVVTLVGKRGEYKGDPQMTEATLENSYSVTEVTIAEFLTKEDNPSVYYRVTGTVTEIANATYGNLYLSDGTNSLYVYGCYPGWGATGDARKDCIANQGIEVGDLLTVTGPKSTYNGVPQVNGGVYISHQKPE